MAASVRSTTMPNITATEVRDRERVFFRGLMNRFALPEGGVKVKEASTERTEEEQRCLDNNEPFSKPKIEVTHTLCCGFKYYHGLQKYLRRPNFGKPGAGTGTDQLYAMSPAEFVQQARERMYIDPVGQIAFVQASGNFNPTIGNDVAAYITEHDLGRVVNCGEGINPNSMNTITTFIWTPNEKARNV